MCGDDAGAKKRVRFDRSVDIQKKKNAIITVDNVHEAYTLLLHAILPKQRADEEEDIIIAALTNTWEMLNITIDKYRKLLLSACLLLEMLPPSPTTHAAYPTTSSTTTTTTTTNAIITIPPPHPTKAEILTTCRSCIRKLRHLERVCAIKTISNHRRTQHQSLVSIPPQITAARINCLYDYNNEGGDDIHDYDRSYSDLILNYDWHDDGFLPLPLLSSSSSSSSSSNNYKEEVDSSSSSEPSLFRVSTDNNNNNNNNILVECLYRPKYTSDPPSSKYERNAYTRDWVRGERVISLHVEDYYYYNENEYSSNDNGDNHFIGDYEQHCVDEVGRIVNMMNDDEVDTLKLSSETTIDDDDNNNNNSNNDDDDINDNDDDDINVSLFICPKILAQEEAVLLNVMLHHDDTNYYSGVYHNPSLNRARSIKERKKKKRKRQLEARKNKARLIADAATTANNTPTLDYTMTTNNPTTITRVHAKEGYLLLLHDHYDNNSSSSTSTISSSSSTTRRSTRVYIRLHPSGWLIVEDRSIRNSHTNYDNWNEQNQQQLPQSSCCCSSSSCTVKSIPRRLRYRDYYIDPATTTCTPCIINGETIFQFQLKDVIFLGTSAAAVSPCASSSSLVQQESQQLHDIERNAIEDNKTNSDDGVDVVLTTNISSTIIPTRTTLVFKIDEGTGGDFMDGYDWVNCITGHLQ